MNTTTTAPIAHAALRTALLGKDEPALQRLVADRCSIIGPKGFHIAKQDWIRPHVDDVYELVALDVVETDTETYGDTSIVVEVQQSHCVYNGEHIKGLFRVTSVWHRDEVVSLQYTAIAEEAQS